MTYAPWCEGVQIYWPAVSAIGTIFSALVALSVALLSPHYVAWINSKKVEKENRRRISTYIQRFDDALESLYWRCIFEDVSEEAEALRWGGRHNPEQLAGTGIIAEPTRELLRQVQRDHLLFDEITGRQLVNVVDKVFDFERTCVRLGAELSAAAGDQRLNTIYGSFEHAKGELMGALSPFGTLLEAYGAAKAGWHQNDYSNDIDPPDYE